MKIRPEKRAALRPSRRLVELLLRMIGSAFLFSSFALGSAPGEIRGQVQINSEPADGAVVYLTAADGRLLASTLVEKTIRQENIRFQPDFLAVPVGTTLRFENHDDEIHNIHSKAGANRFDTGAHLPGTIKTVILKKPGAVPLRCRTHQTMRGLIYVVPSPYFSMTDDQGRFAIRDAPPRNYRLIAWHARLSPEEQTEGAIDLKLGAEVRTVDLRLRAKAEPGADLTETSDQAWLPVVEQIRAELAKAIALWKKGNLTPATAKVMSIQSRLYGESGLREAIAQRLGKDRAAGHERRLDAFRKRIQGIGGEETTEAALKKQSEEIFTELMRDAERLDR